MNLKRYARNVRRSVKGALSAKARQHQYEDGIEIMHSHEGYSEFSKLLRSFIPPNAKVLDIGCNKGLETAIISKTNEVMGIDLFEDFVAAARQRGVNAEVMDFAGITFENEFDCAYSNNSLEHAEFPLKVVDGIHRALKKDGVAIIGLPTDGNNYPSAQDPAHLFKARKDDVLALFHPEKYEILKADEIDTKAKWNWEIPPSSNKMLIVLARVIK